MSDDADQAPEQAPPPFAPDDDAVPIVFVPSPPMAHIVAGVLRSGGVRAVVVGEHAAAAFGPAGTVTAVSVLVPRSRYERGIEVLHAMSEDRIARLKASGERRCLVCGYDMKGLEEQDRCPECGTNITQLMELSRVMTIAPPTLPQTAAMRAATMAGCLAVAIIAVVVVGWVMLLFTGVLTMHGR